MRRLLHLRLFPAMFAVVVFALSIASSSRADLVPPPGDCEKKKAGEPCTSEGTKKAGACGNLSSTSTNHATDPPTTNTKTYFGCVEGATPTVKAKSCALGVTGRRGGGEDSALVVLAFAGLLVVRRRRA